MLARTGHDPTTTSQRILRAAEDLFARKGIRGTSFKEITQSAKVNIAAVNYHFRTKDALVRAVYERCLRPLNEERLRLLTAAEMAAGDGPLALESVLYALFEPMLRTWRSNRNFILLVGRLQNEPDPELSQFIQSLYRPLIPRFMAAACKAAPDVPEPDLFFWIHFLFGGVIYSLINFHDLEQMHEGQNLLDTPEVFLERLIAFGTAGLRVRRIISQVPLPSPAPVKPAQSNLRPS